MLGACSTFAKTSVKTSSPQLCKVCLPNKRRPVAPFSAEKFQCYCILWRDVAGKGCFPQGGLSKDDLWVVFFKWKATKGISRGPAAGSSAHVEQHLCLASTWVRSVLQRVFGKVCLQQCDRQLLLAVLYVQMQTDMKTKFGCQLTVKVWWHPWIFTLHTHKKMDICPNPGHWTVKINALKHSENYNYKIWCLSFHIFA